MQPYPKCKCCGHSKTKHKFLLRKYLYCDDCARFFQEGPTYEWEYDVEREKLDPYHRYNPDNLTYIEKLAERRGLV